MFHIMPTRSESLVYFDSWVDAERLLAFHTRVREAFECDFSHLLVAAVGVGLREHPELNKFVSGRRLYQRSGRFVTFSMKRKALDKKSKLGTVKTELRAQESLRDLVERLNHEIEYQRSGQRTYHDKEYALFDLLPNLVLGLAARFLAYIDSLNLLPGSFIETDALYTSVFIANLGSLGMDPGYHHLYEWGNCPLFLMAGSIQERPVVIEGAVQARPMLHLRWTYDERIDDGLTARDAMRTVVDVLSDPASIFGELGEHV